MIYFKRNSIHYLVRSSKLAGEFITFKTLRSKVDSNRQEKGTERLVRTRSGTISKLRIVNKVDESSDLKV